MGDLYAEKARALVGCRFRPQGREAATGLDCVGLVVVAFGIRHESVPRNYRLRGRHRAELERRLDEHFRRIAITRAAPGDVLLFQIADCQSHLAIQTDVGFVHADARLGRVVESSGPANWPIVAAFRCGAPKLHEAV